MSHTEIAVRWLLDGTGKARENIVVHIEDQHFADFEQRRTADSHTVMVPAIVNAHTHAELSDVTTPFPAGATFPDWIRRVIHHRQNRPDPPAALRRGFELLDQSGAVRVADTVPAVLAADQAPAPGVIRFVEYIGLTPDRIQEAMQHAGAITALPQIGISPHAPYSVAPALLEHLVHLAASANVPVMMHVAETREEIELLEQGTGPFATMLQNLGLWEDSWFPSMSVLDTLATLSKAPRGLLAHGNYLEDAEIDFLATCPQLSVVYCPRTHAHFRHSAHPFRKLLERGINVCLGTDSLASNPDLNIWREAAFIARHDTVSEMDILRLATLNGSQALTGTPDRIRLQAPASFTVLEPTQSPAGSSLFERYVPVGGWLDGAPLRRHASG